MFESLYTDYRNASTINMKRYFGIGDDFASDIMFAQSQSSRIESLQKPLSMEDAEIVDAKISNDFIKSTVLQRSKARELQNIGGVS